MNPILIIILFFPISAVSPLLAAVMWSGFEPESFSDILGIGILSGYIFAAPAIIFYLCAFFVLRRKKLFNIKPYLLCGTLPSFVMGLVFVAIIGGFSLAHIDAWLPILMTFTLCGLVTSGAHVSLINYFEKK